MPSPTRRAAQLALQADLRDAAVLILDTPDHYPHAARYVSAHGRLPSWAQNWGNTRPLTSGCGWAARLWASDVPLSAVTVHVPQRFAENLDTLPGGQLLPMLRLVAQTVPYRPAAGALCAEWTPAARWHWHGVMTTGDAERLTDALTERSGSATAALGADLLGRRSMGRLHALPVSNIQEMRDAIAYMHKGVRQDAGPAHLAAHAERLLALRAELGTPRLPRLTTVYG